MKLTVSAGLAILFGLLPLVSAADTSTEAGKILDAAGVKGGLVVVIGAGDGQRLCALRLNPSFTVQGLASSQAEAAEARKSIRSHGDYGPVSAVAWQDSSRLPYADNMVNVLIVADKAQSPPREEMLRVLVPGGAAVTLDGGRPTGDVVRKPWPADIDQWTHAWHDAGGNAVANDKRVGPPARMQWTAGPLWQRSHGWTPSLSAMVTAGGRVLSVYDYAPIGVGREVVDQYRLTARDAFNGMPLWEVPLKGWEGGTAAWGVGGGRWSRPDHIARRLVATDRRVFVTLGATAPVSILRAEDGTLERVCEGSEGADELALVGGLLVISRSPPSGGKPAPSAKEVLACDPDTGRASWRRGGFAPIQSRLRGADELGRLELVAGDGRVFVLTTDEVIALDLHTGKDLWRKPRPALAEGTVHKGNFAVNLTEQSALIYHGETLLLAQPEPQHAESWYTTRGALYAFEPATGQQRWKQQYGTWGVLTQPDVFVIGNLVWTHAHRDVPLEIRASNDTPLRAKQPDKQNHVAIGIDLKTGEIRQRLSTAPAAMYDRHHHRCWRNRSTSEYLMLSWRGPEFLDLASGEMIRNPWTRGACLYGMMPANGLLYVPPHHCACYPEGKIRGFWALAAKSPAGQLPAAQPKQEAIVERTPAPRAQPSADHTAASAPWPTYRHDGLRSGGTDVSVPAKLAVGWTAKLGGRPGALVVAEGRVLTVIPDQHTVQAIDAESGKLAWSFTAGARIDTPPTCYQGLALFGAADGWVYALRMDDGARVWRLRAAPQERWVGASGQVESAWPAAGSVLIQDGLAWVAAGRSSYLDGGISVLGIRPSSGEIVHRVRLDSAAVADKLDAAQALDDSANLGDVLSGDGGAVFLRHRAVFGEPKPDARRVFTSSTYTDSSWFNRTEWICGPARSTGLIVSRGNTAFAAEVYPGVSREDFFKVGQGAYRVMAIDLGNVEAPTDAALTYGAMRRKIDAERLRWSVTLPTRVTATLVANSTLFAAGAPDEAPANDPTAAFDGRRGGKLWSLSVADGKTLAEQTLAAPPVWDGMAAAEGKLFISLQDGTVVCLTATNGTSQ